MAKEIKRTKKVYNRIAKDYYNLRTKKYREGWFYNELLEMPTTLKILGKIKNKKILDLGCGLGIYAKILTKKGAIVKGIDISDKEIEIARRENPGVELIVGDAEKTPYKNKEFDIVLAALVIGHLKDWSKILKEVNRILKNKGLFIFSDGNPVVDCIRGIKKDKAVIVRNYFKEQKAVSKWWKGVYMHWYPKTYNTIINLLIKNGFELVDYMDCKPIEKAKKLFPQEYADAMKLPYFCTWKWRKK